MKRALVIGAGEFGRYLVAELLAAGCAVDVIDKDPNTRHLLHQPDCRFICNNGWNLASMADVPVAEYDCCYICTGTNQWMNERIVSALRARSARQIVLRAKQSADAPAYLAAGADRVICPAQLAGHALAAELAGCGPL